ncbi:MAG: pilus assembly protein PilM [Thermoguttaceae bacterium]|nr:pilus assembly protein PilM [Thermoguttaceae bacterium]
MARSNAVWGIDVGNCSFKAMRCCVEDSDPSTLIVDAVDYIEYPQILTQPGVDAEESIREAMKLFLSRNKIKGDKIAVSVGGQNGLVRFLKLPPIEPKKIPDIVKYEAKQQIAFLNEVIWKWQRLGQQGADSAFPLEVEIGLFAVKREQVFKTIDQCESLDIPVDCIQLTPLALYNYLMHDEMGDLPSIDDYDPETPPPYVVAISMGTDATDLILTNGFRAWQRNLPIGGNHFTKALMKELKLTFAKADHLKRNLASSQDKVAVLRAMQPVFNQFQNEIQRSLGFFSSLDPNAEYKQVIALGNGMKLTGLTKYLSQNLGIDVIQGNSFTGLDTSNLADSSLISENMSTFGTCYGLCLQALKKGAVNTNFLPGEIKMARIINAKKPWMLAAATLLMLGSTINFGAQVNVQDSVAEKNWSRYESEAESLTSKAKSFTDEVAAEEQNFQVLDKMGNDFLQNFKNRTNWIELLYGINACLPSVPKPEQAVLTAEEVMARPELHVVNIEAQPLSDYESEEWMKMALSISEGSILSPKLAKLYRAAKKAEASGDESGDEEEGGVDAVVAKALAPEPIPGLTDLTAEDEEGEEAATEEESEEEDEEGAAPKKPARWLVSVYGYHWHNGDQSKVKYGEFVRDNFVKKISGEVECRFKLPLLKSTQAIEPEAVPEELTMKDLGVRYPLLVNKGFELMYGDGGWNDRRRNILIRDEHNLMPDQAMTGMNMARNDAGMNPANADSTDPNAEPVELRTGTRYDFVVHFLWEPKSSVERAETRVAILKAEEERKKAEEEADEMSADDEDENEVENDEEEEAADDPQENEAAEDDGDEESADE